jgi:hypothetical protein
MRVMYFVPQTGAEQDKNLVDCFYDKDYNLQLIEYGYSFISGRKGMGKTALAKFAQDSLGYLPIDHCERIPLSSDLPSDSDISSQKEQDKKLVANKALLFILIRMVKRLLKNNHIKEEYQKVWRHFLKQNNYYEIEDFKEYRERTKSKKTIIKPDIKTPLGGGSIGSREIEKEIQEVQINDSIDYLWDEFLQSIPKQIVYHVYLDDVDTRLDLKNDPKNEALYELIVKIQDFNSKSEDSLKNIKIIMCLRSDIWKYIEGSNRNKYLSSCLNLEWDEEDFLQLMGRRINPRKDNPADAVEELFPSNLFEDQCSNAIKKFDSSFYTYLYSISFNRARDFLQYGFIASKKCPKDGGPLEKKHLYQIEREFCVYIRKELEDELVLLSQKYGFDIADIDEFLSIIAELNSFNVDDVRKTKQKTKKLKGKIDEYPLLKALWEYSIIGEERDGTQIFFYHNPERSFPSKESVKNDKRRFCMHEGLKKAYYSHIL